MDTEALLKLAEECVVSNESPGKLASMVRRPYIRYYEFLFNLARETKPELMVELGTNQGISALHFKAGHTSCQVITIDIKTSPKVKKNLKENNIILIESDSVEAACKVPSNIDVLFIDANHTYKSVKNDFEAYLPKVKKGGIILFDDISFDRFYKSHPKSGMDRFWSELKGDKVDLGILHAGPGFGGLIK